MPMGLSKRQVLTCDLLVKEFFVKQVPILNSRKLRFGDVQGKDVYNITAPFRLQGETFIAGRVESRDSEDSEVVFFAERGGVWLPREGAPVFRLQDPFFCRLKEEIIIGGVRTFPHPDLPGELDWRTELYRGTRLENLSPFFEGPNGMKDIRLVELAEGDIGVFTRPQGKIGGRGKIGFIRIPSIDELTRELIEEAPLLEGQFINDEWGGVNEAHLLANGLVGVLGHIARFDDEGKRHYYPMVFALEPETGNVTDIELIAVRDSFLPGPAKRDDLQDVVFSGGLVRSEDGSAMLYAGISDTEAHCIAIPDPFLQYETIKIKRN